MPPLCSRYNFQRLPFFERPPLVLIQYIIPKKGCGIQSGHGKGGYEAKGELASNLARNGTQGVGYRMSLDQSKAVMWWGKPFTTTRTFLGLRQSDLGSRSNTSNHDVDNIHPILSYRRSHNKWHISDQCKIVKTIFTWISISIRQ